MTGNCNRQITGNINIDVRNAATQQVTITEVTTMTLVSVHLL